VRAQTGCDRLRPAATRQSLCSTCVVGQFPHQATAMPPERGHVHADEPGDDDFDERDESPGRWSTDPGTGSQPRGIALISATSAVAASELRRFDRPAGGRSEPSTPSVKANRIRSGHGWCRRRSERARSQFASSAHGVHGMIYRRS